MAFQNIITDIGYGKEITDEHPLPDSLKSIKKEKLDKYFTALARWLYSYSDLPINELMKYLDTEKTQFALGQPQQGSN